MLAKKLRLNLKDAQNRELFRSGFRWSKGDLLAYFDFQSQSPQLGLVIPKSQIAKATDRNALRRLMHSALPEDFKKLDTLRLIIRIGSARATRLSQPDLKKWFEELFQEISRVINEKK